MQAPHPRSLIHDLFQRSPQVGDLMALCEENYGLLRRLAPAVERLTGSLCSSTEGGADLFLTVLDQARYTTELRLTHAFAHPTQADARGQDGEPNLAPTATLHVDPDVRLRVYHDACQVEVLDLRQTALPIYSHYRHPALAAKWRANLFLTKWLGYCLREGHRFPAAQTPPSPVSPRELSPSC
jgi:uncharacterized protein YqiB (DUF1249 family)